MQQEIYITTSNVTVINGINDFKTMMRGQTDIKPKAYLPIFAYLDKYAESIKPKENKNKEQKEQEKTTMITTNVYCKNSEIIESYKKIENKLYNQTKIAPETYLIILDKISEFMEILEKQEQTGIANIPNSQTPATKNENTKTETIDKQTNDNQEKTEDKKDESKNLDLSSIKQFF